MGIFKERSYICFSQTRPIIFHMCEKYGISMNVVFCIEFIMEKVLNFQSIDLKECLSPNLHTACYLFWM